MMEEKKNLGEIGMWKWFRWAAVLVAGVALLIVLVKQPPCNCGTGPHMLTPAAVDTNTVPTGIDSENSTLPRLLDLGAGKCIPCKMMAPILDELKKTYAGQLNVEFIDVWKNPEAGGKYGIRLIPTQVFYDADGKERFRHEGFFSREDILKKWKELGVSFEKGEE